MSEVPLYFTRDYIPRALVGGAAKACPEYSRASSHPGAGGLDPRDLKTALFCISFLRKGEVLAYVGRIHNLEDL